MKGLLIRTSLWAMHSEQEFVYVGDAGIVEPSGASRRFGVEFLTRYQITPFLFADAGLSLTNARANSANNGEDYIPLAPSLSSIGGITLVNKHGFTG
jgi:hypothetical protein